MNQRFRPLTCFLGLSFAVAIFAGYCGHAIARDRHKHSQHARKADADNETGKRHSRKSARHKGHKEEANTARHKSADAPSAAAEAAPLTGDLAAVRNAINLARKGKSAEATEIEKTLDDPAARKLVEWFLLRHPDADAKFARYAAFIAANPSWPSMGLMRRRAEARLWQERIDAATVHGFTQDRPVTAKGRFALARALMAEGDRDGATSWVREAWRSEELGERIEAEAFETFRELLTAEDHRARMDKRIGAKDFSGAMRAARHLGDDGAAIVKACVSVAGKSDNGSGKLDDVATESRQDLGYILCRIHAMVRQNQLADAARLMLAAPMDNMVFQDTDEWWRERRILTRKLLDQGDFTLAYQVAREAATPANEFYRAESHFLPGWIALRYLNDPATARRHFAYIDAGSVNPIVLARANYWRGRVAEATADYDAMQAHYEAAARFPTAYYGQLARAKLGFDRIELRTPQPANPSAEPALSDERARAADMLYTLGERDAVLNFVADLSEQCVDVAALAALGEVTGRHNDAHAMLELGKNALSRGLALDIYAFPTIGIPPHTQFGQEIDRSIIYAVARTESAFDQRDKSPANAVGLMQVTPEAGRDTAKRFGVSYDWDRMVSDPVYNTQMGAAELSALIREYRGDHIMTFAGYNAGRGRVRDWVKQYGDPRDPNVDPVDWVERIPIAETRNYVQRVMENLQIYRVRFDAGIPLTAKLDQRRDTAREATALPPPTP